MSFEKGDKVMFIGPHDKLSKEDHLVLMKVYTVLEIIPIDLNVYAIDIGAPRYYHCPILFSLV